MNNELRNIDGRYEPQHLLGHGGFGHVYLVNDTQTGRKAALKFLTGGGGDGFVRFRREARLLATLRGNPYVVQIIGENLDHTPPYIVTEFCEFGSLRTWVGANRPWRDVAAALAQVVLGLDGLHRAGGFHRDLKPENILVARHPQLPDKVVLKVGDWGLARSPQTDAPPMTQNLAGTRGYIAPEVLAGQPFTAAADIYSVGVIASELLTGTPDGQRLSSIKVPADLRGLVRQMLSLTPAVRPSTAKIAQVLQQIVTDPNVIAIGEPPGQDASTATSPGALLFGGLLLGGVVMALAALAGGGDGEGPPPKAGGGAAG